MSLGGLLGNALLGGIQGGATASYKIGEREREVETRAQEREADQAFQLNRDKLASQKAVALEKLRSENNFNVAKYEASTRKPESPWMPIVKTDPVTGAMTYSAFNKQTREFVHNGDAAGSDLAAPGADPGAASSALDYANQRVDEMAGWTSSDKDDFAEYGGDREAARKAFMQEYFQMTGQGAPAADPSPVLSALGSGVRLPGSVTPSAPAAPAADKPAPYEREGPSEAGIINRAMGGLRSRIDNATQSRTAYEDVIRAVGESTPLDAATLEAAMPHLQMNPYYLERARNLVRVVPNA